MNCYLLFRPRAGLREGLFLGPLWCLVAQGLVHSEYQTSVLPGLPLLALCVPGWLEVYERGGGYIEKTTFLDCLLHAELVWAFCKLISSTHTIFQSSFQPLCRKLKPLGVSTTSLLRALIPMIFRHYQLKNLKFRWI